MEERLVGLLMVFYGVVKNKIQHLNIEYLSDSIKKILKTLLDHDGDAFDWSILRTLSEKEVERWQQVVILVENDYPENDRELVENEVDLLLTRIREVQRVEVKSGLETKIEQAEKAGDKEKVKEYIRILQDLIINEK
jgi:hypothetical protein